MKRGFTLIELLVLIAILAIVAAIVASAVDARRRALHPAAVPGGVEAAPATRVTNEGTTLAGIGNAPFTFEYAGHTYVGLYNIGMVHNPDCKCGRASR